MIGDVKVFTEKVAAIVLVHGRTKNSASQTRRTSFWLLVSRSGRLMRVTIICRIEELASRV